MSSLRTTPIRNRDLKRTAKRLYAHASFVTRLLQPLRPYICPFDRLLELIPPGSRVLDVGCGSGLLLALAAEAGIIGPSVGFDCNRVAIDLAQRAAYQLAVEGKLVPEFLQLDVREPMPGGSFDVISMIDVLHHVPVAAQRHAIETAVAAVPPGGMFLYKDISPRPRWRAAMNRLHDLLMVREWVHYVRAEQVVEWATAGGLTLQTREWIPRLWYGHDLLVFERTSERIAQAVGQG